MIHTIVAVLFIILIFMAFELILGIIYAGIELIADIWLELEDLCDK